MSPTLSLSIGLTGGIGSGKSTVARCLAALGAWIVDTDAISRSLTAPGGEALPQVALAFGGDLISADGVLDRDRLRERVFADPDAKARLEAILHPMISERTRAEAQRAHASQGVVFDVPLLAESGHWRERVQRVLVVDCDEALQIERVMARNAWTESQVRQVINQQASRPRRRAIADAVIVNQGLNPSQLQAEVTALWHAWQQGPAR